MNDGVGAFLRRDRKQFGERHDQACRAAGRVAEARCDEARVEAVRADAGSGETAGEFPGEEDIGELRAGLRPPAAVVPNALQIVEVKLCGLMRIRGGQDDSRRRGGGELVAQCGCQQEVGHMVEREGGLQSLGRHAPGAEHGAGIVDERVDSRFACGDRFADPTRLRHAGEIRQMHAMPEPRRSRLKLAKRCFDASRVARDEDNARPYAGKLENRDCADAGRRPRCDDGFALRESLGRTEIRNASPFRKTIDPAFGMAKRSSPRRFGFAQAVDQLLTAGEINSIVAPVGGPRVSAIAPLQHCRRSTPQRLVKISDEVVRIFDADRKADQSRGDP